MQNGWFKMRTGLLYQIRKVDKHFFCPHKDRVLVVTKVIVTTETVIEICPRCYKQFGNSKIET